MPDDWLFVRCVSHRLVLQLGIKSFVELCHLQMFTDDAAVIGHIQGGDITDYL